MRTVSDSELLHAWQRGDFRSGELFTARYLSPLHNYFRVRVTADMEDLTQETLIQVFEFAQGRDFSSENRSLGGLIFQIARNVLLRRLRRYESIEDGIEGSVSMLHDRLPQIDVLIEHRERLHLVSESLSSLPIADQEIVELRYFHELTTAEVSEVMGMSASQVRSRLSRARKKLKKQILTRQGQDQKHDQTSSDSLSSTQKEKERKARGTSLIKQPSRTITWLHLSDLHACRPRTGWDAQRVLHTLCDDLQAMEKRYNLHPDLIFFTGDAAYGEIGSGEGETLTHQFREASDFFSGVREAFTPPVSQRNFFIVPGNHDVNIQRISRFENSWIDGLSSLDEVTGVMRNSKGLEWSRLMERFYDYAHFLRSYGYEHLLGEHADHLFYTDSRDVRGVRVGVSGFNTAWSSRGAGRTELGRLWAGGRFQLELARKSSLSNHLNIALMHHPGNWLVAEENPHFAREVERDFEFVLHGHEHSDFVRANADTGHSVISSGACHEWSQGKNNGYSFVRLELDSMRGDVWLRRYDPTGGGWGPRFVAGKTKDNGIWPLEHLRPWMANARFASRKEIARVSSVGVQGEVESAREVSDYYVGSDHDLDEALGHVVPFEVKDFAPRDHIDYERQYRGLVKKKMDRMQLFGIDVPREAKQYSLSVAYVSLALSREEGEARNSVSRVVRRIPGKEHHAPTVTDRTISAEDLFFSLDPRTRGRLLILGGAGSGKTTLLRWAAVQAAMGPPAKPGPGDWRLRTPFLVRLRDFSDGRLPRPDSLPSVLAKVLPDPPTGWMARVLRGRAVILFDGLDEVPRAARSIMIEEIFEFTNAYPNNIYVVSTRPEAIDEGVFRAEKFVISNVEPLSLTGRTDLIDRWHKAMESQLRSWNQPEDLRPVAKRLKARLLDTPSIARLTTTPLLCAAMCALHRMREDLPDTPVEVCEKICEMLIVRRGRERGTGCVAESELDGINYPKRKGILSSIAYRMVIGQVSSLHVQDTEEVVRSALDSYALPSGNARVVLQALLERSGLLQRIGEEIEFAHNTIKEYLAAERIFNEGDVETLASNFGSEAWRYVTLFVVMMPREGSDFATRLLKQVLRSMPPTSEHGDVPQECFFFFRCCAVAYQVRDSSVREAFRELSLQLVPPKSIAQAEGLAECGESVIPYLARNSEWTPAERLSSVRVLGRIGGTRARRCLATYSKESDVDVLAEMIAGPASRICPVLLSDSIEALNISSRNVADISMIRGMTGVRSLDVSGSSVSSINALQRMNLMEDLDLGGTPVDDILVVSNMPNLRRLSARRTRVSDIRGLAEARKLSVLDLSQTDVVDLSPLEGLSELSQLLLTSTDVRDIGPLRDLVSLRELRVNLTRVDDIVPLCDLFRLHTLDLSNSRVRKFSVLREIQSLRVLRLLGVSVRGLGSVASLSNLQRLDLNGEQVRDFSPLYGMRSLVDLRIDGMKYDEGKMGEIREAMPWCDVQFLGKARKHTHEQQSLIGRGNDSLGSE